MIEAKSDHRKLNTGNTTATGTDNTLIAAYHGLPKRTLDPIVTLLHPDSSNTTSTTSSVSTLSNRSTEVTSVCFLNHSRNETATAFESFNAGNKIIANDDDDDESDADDNSDSSSPSPSPVQLQCAALIQQQQQRRNDNNNVKNRSYYEDTYDLPGRLLASCDISGTCYIWDIGRRQIIDTISSSSSSSSCRSWNGPGLTIRRLSTSDDDTQTDHRFFYQTRDDNGTITLHDSSQQTYHQGIQTISCYSQSFTSAAPCHGNSNLIVIPCCEHSHVMIRDWRMPSAHHPVAYFHGGTGMILTNENDDNDTDDHYNFCETTGARAKQYGMVTSLAMSTSMNKSKTLIACGMENGSVVYHDLSMISSRKNVAQYQPCAISLSTSEPILALDMMPSNRSTVKNNKEESYTLSSFVTVAGMAGNEEDLVALPEQERGRIAVLKTTIDDDARIQVRLRSRISTNDMMLTTGSTMESSTSLRGKPGIGQCRVRPDGRLFAVGGWDKRVRIYDRNTKVPNATTPLAILRGHSEIVNTIDWSCDTIHSGLIATGSSDGKVHIWRCFPSKDYSNP